MTKQNEERIKNWDHLPNMRNAFAFELYKQMAENENIFLLCGDLGYKVFDYHIKDFPFRAMTIGASEQTMLDIAVGLAYKGKIPVCYSITPFLIYRGFETLRTYINHENLNVKLIGSGRDKDYSHDGYSHNAEDVQTVLKTLPNIQQYYPANKDDISYLLEQSLKDPSPIFISLKR